MVIKKSEAGMPKRGTRVKFVVAKKKEVIEGITSIMGPNCFIEATTLGVRRQEGFIGTRSADTTLRFRATTTSTDLYVIDLKGEH